MTELLPFLDQIARLDPVVAVVLIGVVYVGRLLSKLINNHARHIEADIKRMADSLDTIKELLIRNDEKMDRLIDRP